MDQQTPEQTTPQEESIFNDSELIGQGYDKHIRNARIALFVAAGQEILTGLMSPTSLDSIALTYVWTEVAVIAGIFIALALWTKRKPFIAILIGLILYIAYNLFYMI